MQLALSVKEAQKNIPSRVNIPISPRTTSTFEYLGTPQIVIEFATLATLLAGIRLTSSHDPVVRIKARGLLLIMFLSI